MAMNLRSGVIFGALFLLLNIAVGLVETGRSNGADMSSSEETCPAGTYFSSVVPGCVDCPKDCTSEALVDFETCLYACSSKKMAIFFTNLFFHKFVCTFVTSF